VGPARDPGKGSPGVPAGNLARYRSMRDFSRTPEPAGKAAAARKRGVFVVQKHDATRLHYDFRLELEGALKSWAVPKGPSLDPGTKRLAVETEDHPLEYATFEGVIPQGAYGAGPVIVWDRGRWVPQGDPLQGYKSGRLEFVLEGEKLRGGWLLLKLKSRSKDDSRAWLLIKRHDAEARSGAAADLPTLRPESVRSGSRIEVLTAGATGPRTKPSAKRRAEPGAKRVGRRSAAGRAPRPAGPAAPRSPRSSPAPRPGARVRTLAPARLPGSRAASLATVPGAQLCTLVSAAPAGEGWLHEIKFDGYRILCRIEDGRARLISRTGKDWTPRFATVAGAAALLPVSEALLDGEVVCFDEKGRTSFQALQAALSQGGGADFAYCVFDLLHLDGYDLAHVPLLERKRTLARLLGSRKPAVLRYSDHVLGEGPAFYAAACRAGLEGIVSKRSDGHYVAKRTRGWLKVRCGKHQELLIVGFTPHSAEPSALGALLLGIQGPGGVLRYAGKVGTGFSDALRRDLRKRLERHVTSTPVLAHGLRLPGAVWVKPRLVAEVSFTEWTQDGLLRHPALERLREDKLPAEVVEERPTAPPDAGSARTRSFRSTAPSRRAADPGRGDTFGGVRLTHPERVLWAEQGLTKAALASYYVEIAEWILPDVEGRPLTLLRCPEGQGQPCFFQKHPTHGLAPGLGTVDIRASKGVAPYLVVKGAEGLVSLVQMGALELHTWGAHADDVERPDRIVIDLDPDPSLPFARVVAAARTVRARMEALGLAAFVRTTGGKGLHVVTPLRRRHSWDMVKDVARALAESLVRDEPASYLAKASKAARRGKIFVDWLRNTRGATAVATYSSRARAGAPVSVALGWDELDARLDPSTFTVLSVPKRLRALKQDPWAGYARAAAGLARAAKSLGVEAV